MFAGETFQTFAGCSHYDMQEVSMARSSGIQDHGASGKKPRSTPLKGEDAEVKHVVDTHDLSPSQARELVRRHGNDWRKIDEAAKTYKDDK
jgi:hypothetical protein